MKPIKNPYIIGFEIFFTYKRKGAKNTIVTYILAEG